MSAMKIMACVAASVALACAAAPASATTYLSSAAFSAANPGLAKENYSGYAVGALVSNGAALGALSYSFGTGPNQGGIITDIYNSKSGRSLSAKQIAGGLNQFDYFYPGDTLTIFFAHPITAIGIHSNTYLRTNDSLTTSSGGAVVSTNTYDDDTFVFLGYVSDTPFT